MKKDLLKHIKTSFQKEVLPGRKAMLEMAPLSRRKPFSLKPDHNLASVMMMLFPQNGSLSFPLIVRTNKYPKDKHSGQIAFPGGKREPLDNSNWHCALRETEEELGIITNGIERIGDLSPNYIPVSNYLVHPFVSFFPAIPEFNKQDDEVADILIIDVNELLDPYRTKSGTIKLSSGIKLTDIPYFKLSGHKVWGATAMILNEFVHLVKS